MKKILLIEDSPTTAMIEKKQLNDEGFDVKVVNDGLLGLAAAIQLNPDVIILDVILPGIDGLTLFKKFRRQKELQNTPVIVTSTKPEAENLFLNHKINCFFTKPIEKETLVKKVHELTGIK